MLGSLVLYLMLLSIYITSFTNFLLLDSCFELQIYITLDI